MVAHGVSFVNAKSASKGKTVIPYKKTAWEEIAMIGNARWERGFYAEIQTAKRGLYSRNSAVLSNLKSKRWQRQCYGKT